MIQLRFDFLSSSTGFRAGEAVRLIDVEIEPSFHCVSYFFVNTQSDSKRLELLPSLHQVRPAWWPPADKDNGNK